MKQKLNEKLIVYNNGSKYGQVVIIAGGTGSGKSFAVDKFIGAENYKVMNVDDLKLQLIQYDKIKNIDLEKLFDKKFTALRAPERDRFLLLMKKYKGIKISNFALSNSDHVMLLHLACSMLGWKYSRLKSIVEDNKFLPNLLFDITASDLGSIKRTIGDLKSAGYESSNIHLTWVLTNYKVAIVNNKNRPRIVPQDILLSTHLGASQTMYDTIMDQSDIGINGRIDVILNNPENTVFYVDKTTKQKLGVVKDFVYLPVKKERGGWYDEKLWKDKLYRMIMSNTPIMKTLEELLDENS